ncbi:hypothetical protein TVAG_392250 [Trichomonas vaginalis G3]|uniref:Uncharacterized protein n=1 Tax=Trichomonas vaginalis (strain ATCC PRA-98 / G3) TaxID=412133 RepID=A2DWS6_TRIV3|nr:hypothetical protein TVAGG3_0839620 [Trichomonas vaginalis G3]EAY15108.1 hypothetical protein TVAG_392250 [Trichomonas vaginalis G3]KAI5499200.1 hypothetical protein TVAGG3_0839620 [Trichomonas vaginalis G3]|eukprot:XP_001327331.1 hypothetical protein [Trichomonas vaginalis G3]
MLSIFFIFALSDEEETEPNITDYSISIIGTDNINMTEIENLRIKIAGHDGVIVFYNKQGFDKYYYNPSTQQLEYTEDSIFYFSDPSNEYLIVNKSIDNTQPTLTIAFSTPFKINGDVGYVITQPSYEFQMSAFAGRPKSNLTFKYEQRYSIFHSSPILRKALIEIKGTTDGIATYNDNNKFGSLSPVDNTVIQMEDEYNYGLYFKIENLTTAPFIHYRPDGVSPPSKLFVYPSAEIDFSTNKVKIIDIKDRYKSDTVCLCVSSGPCNNCPKEYPVMTNSEANLAFSQYINSIEDSDITAYVDGNGMAYFNMVGYESANLYLIGVSENAYLQLDFQRSSLGLFSLKNANIDISYFPVNSTLHLINAIFENSNIKTGISMLSLNAYTLTSDLTSLNQISQLEIQRSLTISGKNTRKGTPVMNGVYMRNGAMCSINYTAQNILIKDNLILLDYDGLNIFGTFFKILAKSLYVIGDFTESSYVINLDNVNLTSVGMFTRNTLFIISGNCYLNPIGPLPFVVPTPNTKIRINTKEFLKNSISKPFKEGTMYIPTDEVIERFNFTSDSYYFSSINNSFNIHEILDFVLINNNIYNALHIDTPILDDNQTQIQFNLQLEKGSTTVFERGWKKYVGKVQINIIPMDKDVYLYTDDDYFPTSLYNVSSEYTNESFLVRVYPYPTRTPNIVPAIACGTVFGVIFIVLIVLAILMTPLGNMLGLKTFGPLGKDPKKYDFDDDDDAGMEISSDEYYN